MLSKCSKNLQLASENRNEKPKGCVVDIKMFRIKTTFKFLNVGRLFKSRLVCIFALNTRFEGRGILLKVDFYSVEHELFCCGSL